MSKRPMRPRADCPGCGYRHKIEQSEATTFASICYHDHPGGGLCGGSGMPATVPESSTVHPVLRMEKKPVAEFIPFPKIARLSNEQMVVTEKLDGTNACIQFRPNVVDGEPGEGYLMTCQSRNRIITPANDNAGFARWAHDNSETLFADLGYGVHFGEWWGQGIQRRYDMPCKVFSLFNTHRWADLADGFSTPNLDVVPLISVQPVSSSWAIALEAKLRNEGSLATATYTGQRFPKPEGVVCYLTATGSSWKVTDTAPGKHVA